MEHIRYVLVRVMACASQMEAQNTTATPMGRAGVRISAEGVGGRVIRGVDWKWGKQVRIQIVHNYRYLIPMVIQFLFHS